MDTLALTLALALAHDTDRALPVAIPVVRSASWEVVRDVQLVKPSEGVAILTRDLVKVAEPTEITFKGKGE